MKLHELKVLHRNQPVIDEMPEFSWKIESDAQNELQEKYQIIVKDAQKTVWDSGIVVSPKQNFIKYQGDILASCVDYTWSVKVWDNHGDMAEKTSAFTTAFLDKKDWKACWVECPFTRKAANEYKFGATYPAVMFTRKISLNRKVKKAVLYASAHGVYRLYVNGKRPDNREMAPEFTPYDRLMYYQTYDVTELLQDAENILEMYVGDGWYFSAQARPVMKEHHEEPSVIYQMRVEYEDESREWFFSDGSETCRTDYIVYSDLYQGEKQDFTLEKQEEQPVNIKDYGYEFLRAQPLDPVIPYRLIPAIDLMVTPAGEMVVDFGQVMAGRARIHVDVPQGQQVVFEYFETLDENGNYINTMFAPQKDTVVSDGRPIEHEALFTFHGFRYIRVTGMPDARKEDFTAVLLTSQKENVGDFVCSDERLNRLYQNIRWSQYSNMMSVPTDCPSREKAGWTGDILIYARTAMLNEQMTPFLKSWLHSVRMDQTADGTVMIVSPYMQLYDGMLRNVCQTFGDADITGVAGWSDAIVWVPYDMYQMTGDTSVLTENYDAMKKWADNIIRTASQKEGTWGIPKEYDEKIWDTGFHFGEWLVPSRPNTTGDPYGMCKESAFYIAPFFGYMTMVKMREICHILEDEEMSSYYGGIAAKMKQAIVGGIIRRDMLPDYLMGAYVLAFAFDLVPDDLKEAYKEKLISLVKKNGNCLDTGFLATPYLMDVLCQLGEEKLAYEILWQDKRPSWLYEVDHGATTIWEGWDADDAKHTGAYISYNHYAFGCVYDWICRYVAGIDTDTPGYSHIIIRPNMDDRLTQCKCIYVSEAGPITVEWTQDVLDVQIPCNASATVYWKGQIKNIGSGKYRF